MIVEIGIELDKPLSYYQNILISAGAVNTFNCETHDLYWSNKSFLGMTENEIKMACVRYRMCKSIGHHDWVNLFQNYKIFNDDCPDSFQCDLLHLKTHEELFQRNQWRMVFDTYKKDYQYAIGDMKSRIQLQDIDNVGILLYYDNPDYYGMPLEEQRRSLFDELNRYGLSLNPDTLGLDKLRTLSCGKKCYSLNQNG